MSNIFLGKGRIHYKNVFGEINFLFSSKVLIWLRQRSEQGWIICFLTLLCGWKLWWLSKGKMTFSTSWKALVDHSSLLIPKIYCKPQGNLLGANVVNDISSLFNITIFSSNLENGADIQRKGTNGLSCMNETFLTCLLSMCHVAWCLTTNSVFQPSANTLWVLG